MRIALIVIASFVLALFALCEIGLAWPVAWWLYLPVVVAFTIGIVRPVPVRRQLARLGALAAIHAIVATLYFVEWTTRKPFLRDLARVEAGMTEAEVRHIMGRYLEGTGWPAVFGDSSNAPSTLNLLGSGSQFSTAASSSGQLVIRDSLVFRHSNDGAFNSDWGIVSFSNSKVVRVEFSPD